MVDKSRDKLQEFVRTEITHFFEKVLDFAEVAIGDKNVYRSFRAKVLRLGNNAIRSCQKELESHYDIKWAPKVESEDVIEVQQR